MVTADSNGSVHMSVDGENFVPLTLHDDLTFSLADPGSGRRVLGGRFVRDPVGHRDGSTASRLAAA